MQGVGSTSTYQSHNHRRFRPCWVVFPEHHLLRGPEAKTLVEPSIDDIAGDEPYWSLLSIRLNTMFTKNLQFGTKSTNQAMSTNLLERNLDEG